MHETVNRSAGEFILHFPQIIHNWFSRQLNDQKPKGSIATLDGVRAIACIVVVIYHTTGVIYDRWSIAQKPLLAVLNLTGSKGVTLFFVLSGLLLFFPYAQALLFEKRWPQARLFYMRRILRIVPGYFFTLCIFLLFVHPSFLRPHNWGTDLSFLTFFMSVHQSNQVNGVYWTLAVEFQYYMILPFIALAIYGLTRLVRPGKRLWIVLGSLIIIVIWGMVTRALGDALYARPDARSFLSAHPLLKAVVFLIYGADGDRGKFLEDFACGMLVAVCYTVVARAARGDAYRRVLLRLSSWLWWTGILLLIFAAWRNGASGLPYMPTLIHAFDAYPEWANEVVFALACCCCILAILYNGDGILTHIFEWTPLRWIGLISFSLYLWHEPLIGSLEANLAPFLFQHVKGVLALGIFVSVEFVLVLLVSFTLYVLVERPGMRLSERLRNQYIARQKPIVPVPPPFPADASLHNEEPDPEKTEPRQVAIRSKPLAR